VNWSATFYNQTNLSGQSFQVTNINGINFNWGSNPPLINSLPVFPAGTTCTWHPDQGGSNNTSSNCDNFFSARFTSTQNIAPGVYNFVISADDGVRVRINGQTRVDRFQQSPLTTDTFIETITTSPVIIEVEYLEISQTAVIQVQWFLQGAVTGTPGTPVGTPSPVFTPVPPLAGSVQGVKGLAVRTGPYLGASLVTVARPGVTYNPTARSFDEGGPYAWYLITVDGKTGWASGRYLQFTGDPNSVPVVGTVFDQIDNAPAVGAFAVPRAVMNLRRRPSPRAALVGQVPWGETVELIGRTVQGGQSFWLHVRYNGVVGWIYAPFVSVSGNLAAVPIY
jgi:uncharacterized protein YraI